MRILDAFCGAGGAGRGYHDAGFEVVGVDTNDEALALYPYESHRGDALEFIAEHGHEFDAIHASPPCQAYSVATPDPSRHPRLIGVVRILLQHFDVPYVIENVEGAKKALRDPIKLCGSAFNLPLRRHRYFEVNFPVLQPGCTHIGQAIGVYGDHVDSKQHFRPDGTARGIKARSLEEAQNAMGIDWMPWKPLTQAIPPAFSHWIGTWMEQHMQEAAA